jgi:t-SNARE complex subunit (syntaxin)
MLMANIDPKEIRKVENRVRNLVNWVKVFEEEYDLDKEVVDTLRSKLEEIAVMVGNLGK